MSARTLRGNESDEPFVPCSCYNSTATNDSSGFDKLFFSQISRLGPRAKLRQTADLCALPAKAHIYREVGPAVARSSRPGQAPWGRDTGEVGRRGGGTFRVRSLKRAGRAWRGRLISKA